MTFLSLEPVAEHEHWVWLLNGILFIAGLIYNAWVWFKVGKNQGQNEELVRQIQESSVIWLGLVLKDIGREAAKQSAAFTCRGPESEQ